MKINSLSFLFLCTCIYGFSQENNPKDMNIIERFDGKGMIEIKTCHFAMGNKREEVALIYKEKERFKATCIIRSNHPREEQIDTTFYMNEGHIQKLNNFGVYFSIHYFPMSDNIDLSTKTIYFLLINEKFEKIEISGGHYSFIRDLLWTK